MRCLLLRDDYARGETAGVLPEVNYSIIIPSKNAENLRACVAAIRINSPGARVNVIDDGLKAVPQGCEAIQGIKPFVFSRNMNLGINAAGVDDVVLLNDDAVQSVGDFGQLVVKARQNPNIGVLSCAIDGSMQPEQRRITNNTVRLVKHHMVSFVAVCIRREVLQTIGLLDERFTDYGYDDDDYCQRALNAGYQLGVYDGCVVRHGDAGKSTYRSNKALSLEPNRRRFIEKWGHEPGKARRVA